MEAISHASTALGILAKDGLVIAAEKKVASKLLDETTGGEKIYIINEYVSSFFLYLGDHCWNCKVN